METSSKIWIHVGWYGAVLVFVIAYVLWVRFRDANSDRQAVKQNYRLRIQEANDRSRGPIDESVEQTAISEIDRKPPDEIFDSHQK